MPVVSNIPVGPRSWIEDSRRWVGKDCFEILIRKVRSGDKNLLQSAERHDIGKETLRIPGCGDGFITSGVAPKQSERN